MQISNSDTAAASVAPDSHRAEADGHDTRDSDDSSYTGVSQSQESDNSVTRLSPTHDSNDSFDDSPVRKRAKVSNRMKWTNKEVEEIKKYLGEYLSTTTTPGKKDCLKAIADGRKNGGQLQRRGYSLIVKKIST